MRNQWLRRKQTSNSLVDLLFVAMVLAWGMHFAVKQPYTELIAIVASAAGGAALAFHFYATYRSRAITR